MRVFIADEREFPDPDPTLTPAEVLQSLVDFLPDLANAEILESTRGEDTIFDFRKRVGTKG